MTSRIGPKRKILPGKGPSSAQAAFTLIELFIVSAVILVLVGFSTPLFRRTFSDLELRETAANITSFITFAQHKAVSDSAICKLVFDYDRKTYRLFMASAAPGVEGALGYINPKDRFGRLFKMPADLKAEGRAAELFFYPDGHCDKFAIRLSNKNGKTITLATTGVLGNVTVKEERQ
jgi:type II secretory pathway pseudopilin PulG